MVTRRAPSRQVNPVNSFVELPVRGAPLQRLRETWTLAGHSHWRVTEGSPASRSLTWRNVMICPRKGRLGESNAVTSDYDSALGR
jgi:hypothetical protein